MHEDIVVENLDFVRGIARKVARRLPASIDLEDLVGAGNVGLMKAARTFDSTRGIQFRTYAARRIYGAIMDELRELDWVPRVVRDDMALHTWMPTFVDEPVHLLEDRRAEAPERIVERRDSVAYLLSRITNQRERAILVLRYLGGMALPEIAAVFRISVSRVSQLCRHAFIELWQHRKKVA